MRLTVTVQAKGDDGEDELGDAQAESCQVHDAHD